MSLYERIQFLCDYKGITIYKLEQDTGFGKGSIHKWKDSIPSCESLYKVATYLGTSCETLMGYGQPIEEKLSEFHNQRINAVCNNLLEKLHQLESEIEKLKSEDD